MQPRVRALLGAFLLLCLGLPLSAQTEQEYFDQAVSAIIRSHYLFNTSFRASLPVKLGKNLMREADFQHAGILWEMVPPFTAISVGVWKWNIADQVRLSAGVRLMGDMQSLTNALSNPKNFFVPSAEKEVYTPVFQDFTIGSLEGRYCTLSSHALQARTLLFNHLELGYEHEGLGYRVIAESTVSGFERDEAVDVAREHVFLNILNLDLFHRRWPGGRIGDRLRLGKVSLFTQLTFSENRYSGTNSILGTGLPQVPYLEVSHFPQEDDLYVASLHVDLHTFLGNLSIKPTFVSRSPWFSGIDLFWDLNPIIAFLSYGAEPSSWEDSRRSFIQEGEGGIVKWGLGYEYVNYYPFGITPDMNFRGYQSLYFSANVIGNFIGRSLFFLEFSVSLYELSSPQIALNDRYTPPERLELDADRLFDNMRCMIGYIKVF